MTVDAALSNFSLLGSGAKTPRYVLAREADEKWHKTLERMKETHNAHNGLLTVLLEMGSFGLLLSLTFMVDWFRRHKAVLLIILGSGVVLCLRQIFDYFI